jgi:TolB-like protein/class 3 adenylate cyclase/Tfp pilus assembly protein PilF
MTATRRLAAILAADVAGYSRLMRQDEERTHERLRTHLRELVHPKITERRGRIVKNTGDGVLAEFPSVVDAVRCAVEIQRGMIDREPEIPEEHRIRFRISVNLGDVIVEEHDIFGDGVNIAARLEALAEPGGICISRVVRDQIRDRLTYPLEDMGKQTVKNIARPVRVYALEPKAVADLPPSTATPAGSISQPAIAPRLSIVVLPFTNLSNDPEQQYFADSITEDLTTDMSRIEDMFVISRNTAFTYQGKRVDTKQIGRELFVRYVLEGSVRRLGNQVHVNAQLIDAETDAHLWVERFDGDTADLFVLQDEVTRRIAFALDVQLINAEATRKIDDPDALDCILRGRAAEAKPPTRDTYGEAIGWFEQALALDPESSQAQSLLADVLVGRALDQMTDTAAADIARVEDFLGQALEQSQSDPVARYAKGNLLRQARRCEADILEYETVIELDRNAAGAYANLGWCKFLTGAIEEAIPALEYALRLSPRDNRAGNWCGRIGVVHLLQSQTDEAILWLERRAALIPRYPFVHAVLASAYGLKGKTELAAAKLREARNLGGAGSYFSSIGTEEMEYLGVPRSAPYTKPGISPGCARPECRRNDRNPPPCRDFSR